MNDDQVMKSQKSKLNENKIHITEVQEIHIKETKDIKILIHTSKISKKNKKKTSSKGNRHKKTKDEEDLKI